MLSFIQNQFQPLCAFIGGGQLKGRGGPGRIGLRRGMRQRGGGPGRGAILSGRGGAGRGGAGPRGEGLWPFIIRFITVESETVISGNT